MGLSADGRFQHSEMADIHATCDAFEQAWAAGQSPRIEDFLARADVSHRVPLLQELLQIELWWRSEHGDSPEIAEYLRRFPVVGAIVDQAFAAQQADSSPKPPAAWQGATVSPEQSTGGTGKPEDGLKDTPRAAGDERNAEAIRRDLEQVSDPDFARTLVYVGRGDSVETGQVERRSLLGTGHTTNRFRILRPHAKGGLGQVSVALDQELNREVALKEIQPQHADHPVSRERFVLEAEITGGLEHPGIVPVYALGQDHECRPFYAMRFIKGDSLKEAIEAYHQPENRNRKAAGARQLELRRLLGRFIDVCNAMEYAHSRGVLHRDLKPGNIMVGKYGETLVVDWGLAKAVGKNEIVSEEATLKPMTALSSSGQTRPGSAIGTPAYMSPEQAAGKLDELGRASDIYSLGATLYHVLCGKPPFEKGTYAGILQKVQDGDFASPRTSAPDVPKSLEAICLKAMSLRPADRYQTARTLADDLEHWLADEPVTASPDTLGDRMSRFGRKHRGAVQTGGLALALIAVLSIAAAIQINDSRRSAIVLAGNNKRLADEKSKLADAERDAKTKAQELAEQELNARVATEKQLRIATAERLAALSHTMRADSPERSVLLAIESGRVTQDASEGLLTNSHQALLDSLASVGGLPLFGHRDGILSVTISPDNRWLVTVSNDYTTCVWDLRAENPGVKCRVLRGNGGTTNIVISPDSRWLVMGGWDGTTRIWDLTEQDPAAKPRVISGHQGPIVDDSGIFNKNKTNLSISPDSRWLVIAGPHDKAARLCDLTAENPEADVRILAGHQKAISCIAVSSDSRWVVTGSYDGTARVWDLTAEDPGARPRVLTGHDGPLRDKSGDVTGLAITSDSRWLVTASHDDRTARIWDLTAENPGAEPRFLTDNQSFITTLAISPDGRWLATAGTRGPARVWNLKADNPGASPRVLTGHHDEISSVAISSDSHWLVTASRGDETALAWDLTAENPGAHPLVLTGHQGGIRHVAISPRWLVAVHDKTARLWDLTATIPTASLRVLKAHEGEITSIAVSSDGRRLVTGSLDKIARVWDLPAGTSGANPRVLTGHQRSISRLIISPDSRWLVTGSADETARVWDLSSENPGANPRVLAGHQDAIYAVMISPDGHWLLTASYDEKAVIWDMTAENPGANPRVLPGIRNAIESPDHLAISPRWLVFARGKTAHICDLAANNLGDRSRVLVGHKEEIRCVAISPDSHWLVTGSDDNTARIWDLTAENPGATSRVLAGHQKSVSKFAISPDSQWLVTGSSDGTARIWDLTAENPGTGVRVLAAHQRDVGRLAISPDGHWLVTGSYDNTARVWDLTAKNPGAASRVLNGHNNVVNELAISSDSHWLVTGSWYAVGSADNAIRIWDLTVENPGAAPRVLPGESKIASVAISPDGRWLVTGCENGNAYLWRWQWDDLVDLGSRIGRNFTYDEWSQLFTGQPYRKTFPDLPGANDYAREFFDRGNQSMLRGSFDRALVEFTHAIHLDPEFAAAYNSRARLEAKTSNNSQAIADATKACELTEWKSWNFIDTLAFAYAEAGDFENAVKWQSRAVDLAGDDPAKVDLNSRWGLYKSGNRYREDPRARQPQSAPLKP